MEHGGQHWSVEMVFGTLIHADGRVELSGSPWHSKACRSSQVIDALLAPSQDSYLSGGAICNIPVECRPGSNYLDITINHALR